MKIDYKIDLKNERIKPFRIFGNLYYVGARFGTSHLIDTGAGLILLDTGMPQTLHLIVQGMWELGFDPRNIKYILHSHGHYDHIGGTKALAALSGAKTFIGSGDENYVNGKINLTLAEELGYSYNEAFETDEIIYDGDVIRLGNTVIKCLATPGHSPGCMSFFFDVSNGEKTYRAGMHGGVGINTMSKDFLEEYGLSYDCREQFLSGLERLKQEPVDIFLGNHIWLNDMEEKYALMQTKKINPFIGPGEWLPFLERCANSLREQINKEKIL
jgi:metallo-beta-lactamase class B